MAVSSNSPEIYQVQLNQGLALAWVNSYSAVAVKTPGATLLFDPVGMTVPEDAPVDLIAISHEHSDHWDSNLVAGLQERTGAMVATTPFLASQLKPARHDRVRGMQPGDELAVGDARLTALRCDHAAHEALAFLVRTSDQLTVYLPGDTIPFPDMAQLAEGPGINVLAWMGTTLEDGARIAQLVRPKVLVTYAITPRAAGERARSILTRLAPDVPFHALPHHRVFLYP